MSHTPGPWRVWIGKSGSFAVWGGTGREEDVICERDESDYVRAESLANARLIAAAPDLLAALKRASHWIDDDASPSIETRLSLLGTIRAAIAKAEGAAP